MNSWQKGKYAELMARFYMFLHGYHLVCRNFKTGRGTAAGEIDLIMSKGRLLVFIEVKQRGDLQKASYAISKRQQQRNFHGAQSFLQQKPQYQGYDMRFDAILVCFPIKIQHLKNVWVDSNLQA